MLMHREISNSSNAMLYKGTINQFYSPDLK